MEKYIQTLLRNCLSYKSIKEELVISMHGITLSIVRSPENLGYIDSGSIILIKNNAATKILNKKYEVLNT